MNLTPETSNECHAWRLHEPAYASLMNNARRVLMSCIFLLAVWSPVCSLASAGFSVQEAVAEEDTPEKDSTDNRTTTVGYPASYNSVVINGPELVVKPIENRDQELILRIVDSFVHGDGYRYDLEYYGLEPGQYNLADYLQLKNGSVPDNLPNLTVNVTTIKPAGEAPIPNALPNRKVGFRTFYLSILLVGSVLWLLGLLAILFWGRGKTKRNVVSKENQTVADRLRPLISKAVAGELDTREQAELERVLDAFWRKKLRVEHLPAKQFREKLRTHDEASEMLTQLDSWLHRPGENDSVDVRELLQPYEQMAEREI